MAKDDFSDSARQAKKQKRGFAAMDKEKQKEIARKGGRIAHELGSAHQWSVEEARAAGKKGGINKKKIK